MTKHLAWLHSGAASRKHSPSGAVPEASTSGAGTSSHRSSRQTTPSVPVSARHAQGSSSSLPPRNALPEMPRDAGRPGTSSPHAGGGSHDFSDDAAMDLSDEGIENLLKGLRDDGWISRETHEMEDAGPRPGRSDTMNPWSRGHVGRPEPRPPSLAAIREHPADEASPPEGMTLREALRREKMEDAEEHRQRLREENPKPTVPPSGYPRLRPMASPNQVHSPATRTPMDGSEAGSPTDWHSLAPSTEYEDARTSQSLASLRPEAPPPSLASTASYHDALASLPDTGRPTDTGAEAEDPAPPLASDARTAASPASGHSAMLDRWLAESMPPRDALLTRLHLQEKRG
ncbi:hypothetical protein [Paracidovorax avenae]|uniref:hypothetical protein n=1 Tax=Paracidovorax avenae TaxID=80867 RepID=UPI001F3A4F02|nr:hypothetical protein [Paracidovorax avenae]